MYLEAQIVCQGESVSETPEANQASSLAQGWIFLTLRNKTLGLLLEDCDGQLVSEVIKFSGFQYQPDPVLMRY